MPHRSKRRCNDVSKVQRLSTDQVLLNYCHEMLSLNLCLKKFILLLPNGDAKLSFRCVHYAKLLCFCPTIMQSLFMSYLVILFASA
jgi:hypothetical protein